MFNVLVTAFWMSEIESKRRLFEWDFTFGNKKESADAKAGEYGGWSSTVTFRWAKNCLTIVALWDGALSCKKNQSPDSHMPGLTRRILFRSLYIISSFSTLHWWFHPPEQILCGLRLANRRKSPTWSSPETSEIAFFSAVARFLRPMQRIDV